MSWMKHYASKFEAFKSLIGNTSPTIIEIGAHFGEDSARFAEAFPEASIFCFEPDPRCVKVFKKYVKHSNVKLVELALSSTAGEADFFRSFDDQLVESVPDKYDWISIEDYNDNKLSNSGSSSLKPGYRNNLDKIKVKTERFDTWYRGSKLRDIDLVWMDVQGAEKDVIEGFGDILEKVNFIWMEYGESEYSGSMSREETISLLRQKGFKFAPSHSSPATLPQGDLLFWRENE